MSTKRSKAKYPNLDRKLNLKRRQDLIDFDYLDKLNEDELKFLNDFMGEWVGSSFKKDKKTNTYLDSNIHKTQEQREEIYQNNNVRNRDIYTRKSCVNGLNFFTINQLDDLRDKDLKDESDFFEAAMIDLDFIEKNPAIYKEQVQEYLKTLSKTKRKDQTISDRDAYIKFLMDNDLNWTLDD